MLDIEHYFSIHNRSWDCLGEISAQEKQARIDLATCYRLITREPKVNLNLTKRRLLRLKVRFGHLSVTLSNAGHSRKCAGKLHTLYTLIFTAL